MNTKAEPSGIGGWLILPGLGLLAAPIVFGWALLNTYAPLFSNGAWEALTTPGTDAYHQLWAPLLIFEIFGNTAFLVFAVILLFLFFQMHYSLPKWMIVYYLASLIFVTVDFFAADLIPAVAAQPDPESQRQLGRSVIAAAIWVPYFMKSVRVRNTFTKGRVEEEQAVEAADEGMNIR